MKTCPRCKTEKPLDAFTKNRLKKSGLEVRCKACRCSASKERYKAKKPQIMEQQKAYRKANPMARMSERAPECRERARVRMRAYGQRPDVIARELLRLATRRARKRGVPMTLTVADVVIPETCPVLGIPIISGSGGRMGPTDNSPSIDCIIPGNGYVKGNVAVISWRANVLKRDGTPEEHRLVAAWQDSVNPKKGAGK